MEDGLWSGRWLCGLFIQRNTVGYAGVPRKATRTAILGTAGPDFLVDQR